MKKTILSTLTYLLIFAMIYGVVNWYRAPTMPNAPSLSYVNSQNQTIDVVAHSHHEPILIYFWGTWCAICEFTTPNIQTLHTNGTPIITVAVQSDSTEQLIHHMQSHGYDFMTINDLDGSIFNEWQGKVTPSFVILKDGKISQRFTGIAPLWSLKLRLLLSSLSGFS